MFVVRLLQLLLVGLLLRYVIRLLGLAAGAGDRAPEHPSVKGYTQDPPPLDLRDAEDASFEELEKP